MRTCRVPKPPAFDARLIGKGEEKIEVPNEEEATTIKTFLEGADLDRNRSRRRNAVGTRLHRLQLQIATGFFAQTSLFGEAHHDDRAALV